MNKVVVVLILLLIIGLAGAFFYISKLRKAREDRIKQLQTVTGQVSSLKSSLQSAETQAENEARQLKQEKKAKKAELTRIEAERKAEIAKRDALDKMKNAKIAELAEKQKRHEAEIAKTDERRKAAIREADEARAKANAARRQADAAISQAKKSKSLADRAKQVADARTRQADARTRQAAARVSQADARARQAAARASQADARTRQTVARANKEMARMRQRAASEQTKLSGVVSSIRGANVRRAFENARTYNAVPGYFTTGYQFAGDVFGIADPRVCKSLAVTRRHKMWGHRNALHGSPRYKNSCYFYKNGPRFKGNGNDDVHMVGCAFGGSIQNGCTPPPSKVFSLRQRQTLANDWGGGNSIFLDRHNMDCGDDGISSFRLFRPAGNKIAYKYSCLEGTNQPRSNQATRSNDWGGGNTLFLDRHNVDCGNSSIHKIHLVRPSRKRIRYNYACGNKGVMEKTCKNMSTPWNQESNKTIYLDRHNVSCPKKTVLTRFKLQRNGAGKFRYDYTCCQPK